MFSSLVGKHNIIPSPPPVFSLIFFSCCYLIGLRLITLIMVSASQLGITRPLLKNGIAYFIFDVLNHS